MSTSRYKILSMETKKSLKALSSLKDLFLSEPELFDNREKFINNRIDIIEEDLKNPKWISTKNSLPVNYPAVFLDHRGYPHRIEAWQNTDPGYLRMMYCYYMEVPKLK